MIVIGSVAAKLSGCLPSWRDGKTADIDIVLQSHEVKQYLSSCENDTVCVKSFPEFPDHLYVLKNNLKVVDLTIDDHFHYLLSNASEMTSHILDGLRVLCPDPATLLALKKAYEGFPIHREKNDADISFWYESGICVSERHSELMEYIYRKVKK